MTQLLNVPIPTMTQLLKFWFPPFYKTRYMTQLLSSDFRHFVKSVTWLNFISSFECNTVGSNRRAVSNVSALSHSLEHADGTENRFVRTDGDVITFCADRAGRIYKKFVVGIFVIFIFYFCNWRHGINNNKRSSVPPLCWFSNKKLISAQIFHARETKGINTAWYN